MLEAMHESATSLRRRFAAPASYEPIADEPREAEHKPEVDDGDSAGGSDSISLSSLLRAFMPERKPLKPHKLNREIIAYGIVAPNGRQLLTEGKADLPSLFLGNHFLKMTRWDDRDDREAEGVINTSGRLLGMTATRDGAGAVQILIYELPGTPDEKKTFDRYAYSQISDRIKYSMMHFIPRRQGVMSKSDESVLSQYTLISHIDPRLKEAERLGKEEEKREAARLKPLRDAMMRRIRERLAREEREAALTSSPAE